MKTHISLFIILLNLMSCTTKDKPANVSIHSTPSYDYNLTATKEKLRFKLTSDIINKSNCIIPYVSPDSVHYLYYLSGYTNKICVFNIDSQKLINVIELQQRGPDGVGTVNGFEVVNKDSIYIFSNFMRKIYTVNSRGKLLSYIDYSGYKQDYIVHAPNCRTLENMRMVIKDSLIYLPFYPGYDEGNYERILPEDIRFVGILNTQLKVVDILNVGFPEHYWDNGFYPTFFGFFYHRGTFYVNFMFSDNIAISNDGNSWEYINVSTKYGKLGKYISFGKGTILHYSRLVADPYRNLFYRFVEYKQTVSDERSMIDLIRWPKRFSIIILNDKLEIIGETLFPEDKYDMHGYFITKDGLYLSLSNPFNPDYDEDILEFRLFKITKNEN